MLRAGQRLGSVPEKIFKHYIMVPFGLQGVLEVTSIAKKGKYDLKTPIARLKSRDGKTHDCFLQQVWPVLFYGVNITLNVFFRYICSFRPKGRQGHSPV